MGKIKKESEGGIRDGFDQKTLCASINSQIIKRLLKAKQENNSV